MRRKLARLAVVMAAAAVLRPDPAAAVESAVGFYLLGSTTTSAGILPPPGTYVVDHNYIYSGSTNFQLEFAGVTASGGVDGTAYYNVAAPLWVAKEKVLDGHIGFLMLIPIGWKDVEAGVVASTANAQAQAGVQDSDANFGDLVPGMMLGWHYGNWHFKTHTLVNAPTGFWERGNLSNIGFNRWAIDNAAAFTWLDPKIGLELSAIAGITYNWENPATNYKSGSEFHVEYAAVQNFSKRFGLGINGYYYDQITGDSGTGARLGAFKGSVAAIGPVINLNFEVGKIPVAANLKYFHEFEVQNRLAGDLGYVTLTFPLSVPGH
jgi:hypothetical protein